MEETMKELPDETPFHRIFEAVALASLLSLLSYVLGGLANLEVSNLLSGAGLSPQSQFLQILFSNSASFYVYLPWAVSIFEYLVPFLLFFWLSGRARIDVREDMATVAVVAFAWGVLVYLLGPGLFNLLPFGESAANLNSRFLARIAGLVNPFSALYLITGAAFFATIAVAGVSFGSFWRQTPHWSFRVWLNEEEEADPPSEDDRSAA